MGPAGTIATLAITCACRSFNVDTTGWLCPDGHPLRYSRGTTGMLIE